MILIIGFLIYRGLFPSGQQPNNQPNNQGQAPDYVLDSQEEARVKEFVKNFVNLYNSYSFADYSNLTALGDYQTSAMQDKTLQLVGQLEADTPEGFQRQTETEIDTFAYGYPNASQLSVEVKAWVEETTIIGEPGPRSPEKSTRYPVTVKLELSRSGQAWLVNNFEINK